MAIFVERFLGLHGIGIAAEYEPCRERTDCKREAHDAGRGCNQEADASHYEHALRWLRQAVGERCDGVFCQLSEGETEQQKQCELSDE